ncbi:MAG: VacB/RNase II family 3'-5' exoribonuclease [Bryobacterales bacterium]|nr:VacB/RNase II family 3'-5' exoribonuclease [Bryobacterales bacterium]
MPKSEVFPTDEALLEHIARLPHARANFKQLVRETGAKGERRDAIELQLNRLVNRGELVELHSGKYAVTRLTREFAAGRLNAHRDGYAFLISDYAIPGVQGDVFIPPDSAAKAMNGDRVVVRIRRIDGEGKAEGEILRVLKRAHQTVVGEFRIRPRGNFVVPHDERLQSWIEIPVGMEIPPPGEDVDRIAAPEAAVESVEDLDGMIVDVELLDYPDKDSNAVGRVIEILGHPDDFGVDVEIMIRKHHLPHRFPPEVIAQAQSIREVISAAEIARRQDFRALDVVTIDGETARDFDDAVWVDRLPGGNFALHVHIGDVGYYVAPGTPIDDEARLRGTSVYFPDRAVPMLPLELSTGICSLNPGVDRLVLSVLLEIDHSGDVVGQRFTHGVIRSRERMTYTAVHALLDGDLALAERYRGLAPRFELMRELALILNARRVKRGSIDFDLPEPLIEFDEAGEMAGIARSPRNIAHRIIEEFMLAANEAVAGHLEALGIPSVYRIHEPPNPERVFEFEKVAVQFGVSLGIGGAMPVKRFGMVDRKRDGRKIRKDVELLQPVSITSKHYQRLVAKLEGKPEERILNYLMLRSLRQARYSEKNQGHFALAAAAYTHFTSPIRRYPDLLVHRILAARLRDEDPPYAESTLRELARECSDSERHAAEAERELIEWKKATFMAGRVGEDFAALIISTTRFGAWIELEELFVEGLIPVDLLPGDRYQYHENTRRIIGERTRRQFAIGDRVRVILDRVDAVERKLQFSLYEPEARHKRRR